MNIATRIVTAASALALTLAAAAPALAQLTPQPAQFFGELRVDAVSHNSTWISNPGSTELTGDVYNNTNPRPPANFGFANTDLAAVYGDRVSTTGTGLLLAQDFTVYNSNLSAGTLLTAQMALSFYDGVSNLLIGQYLANLNFGAGIPAGFFGVVTITNLGPANINLGTQDLLVTQQLVSKTGAADQVGIASLDPPTIGSSTNVMFINSALVGPAAYYNIGNPPLNANPGYRINVNTAVPVQHETWGHVKSLYH